MNLEYVFDYHVNLSAKKSCKIHFNKFLNYSYSLSQKQEFKVCLKKRKSFSKTIKDSFTKT